jgi:hypothetical protein
MMGADFEMGGEVASGDAIRLRLMGGERRGRRAVEGVLYSALTGSARLRSSHLARSRVASSSAR